MLIENGVVYDGLGGAPVHSSVLVEGGRIRALGIEAHSYEGERHDAGGLAIAPGFVDMHTHSDVSVLSDPDCVSAIWQGITSQVVGHCGFSAAPTDSSTRQSMRLEEPVFGFPGPDGDEAEWGWDTMTDYLDALADCRPRTNVGTFVGHNTLRRLVVGSQAGEPDDSVLSSMADRARSSIEEGALGVTTGLSYPPGIYASTREIIAIARVAAECGRRYHTHMRYGSGGVRSSLEEAIATGRAAECSVNVSHLYPSPTDAENEVERLFTMIEAENRGGGDVTFDLTLFVRGGGAWAQSLPAWALEGGLEGFRGRLADPQARARLLAGIEQGQAGRDWDDDLIVKVSGEGSADLVGRSIGEMAEAEEIEPAEMVLRALGADPQFWVAPTIKRQTDLDELLRHELCIPVTDGMSSHPQRHAHLGLMPKTFGTFPLLFQSYVRERGVLGLPEAIARATSAPADRLGLPDRGRLVEGNMADIVIFDPMEIASTGTDEAPGQQPRGVRDVMVNGSWAMLGGILTADRRGDVLT